MLKSKFLNVLKVHSFCAEFINIAIKLHQTYGDCFGFWIKSDFYAVLSDPNVLEVSEWKCFEIWDNGY